jgi:hypothetical protein
MLGRRVVADSALRVAEREKLPELADSDGHAPSLHGRARGCPRFLPVAVQSPIA